MYALWCWCLSWIMSREILSSGKICWFVKFKMRASVPSVVYICFNSWDCLLIYKVVTFPCLRLTGCFSLLLWRTTSWSLMILWGKKDPTLTSSSAKTTGVCAQNNPVICFMTMKCNSPLFKSHDRVRCCVAYLLTHSFSILCPFRRTVVTPPPLRPPDFRPSSQQQQQPVYVQALHSAPRTPTSMPRPPPSLMPHSTAHWPHSGPPEWHPPRHSPSPSPSPPPQRSPGETSELKRKLYDIFPDQKQRIDRILSDNPYMRDLNALSGLLLGWRAGCAIRISRHRHNMYMHSHISFSINIIYFTISSSLEDMDSFIVLQ